MIAITAIGTYLPKDRVSNLELLDKFKVTEDFIKEKIGVLHRAKKKENEKASDLCLKAYKDLVSKKTIDPNEIECCIVVTQNPDYNIPHTSAIVHGALGLSENCACFDISLGCSGYVYGLSVISSFMNANGYRKGILFTADPYSEIIDENDKNTALIFGDGGTVSLLEADKPGLVSLGYDLGSKGSGFKNLINEDSLFMNGRMVFNFTAGVVPKSINKLLDKLDLEKNQIDKWYLHQGSKYIVDNIKSRLGLDEDKVVFGMKNYGNTVSSSIPMLLSVNINDIKFGQKIGMSGFGVGLSWASAIFEKRN